MTKNNGVQRTSEKNYLFFYGTLQPGGNLKFFEENKLGDKLVFVGRAVIHGDLEHLRNRELNIEYPGIINLDSSKNLVYGSVYEVLDTTVLKVMDEHEGYSPELKGEESRRRNFYERVNRKVAILGGKDVDAGMYSLNTLSEKYNSDIIEKLGIVEGGDWLVFLRERDNAWKEKKAR